MKKLPSSSVRFLAVISLLAATKAVFMLLISASSVSVVTS